MNGTHSFSERKPCNARSCLSRPFYEGTIHEVREEIILFSWAPSPFAESDDA